MNPVHAKLRPGDWTPTGWGAQHRVRCSDEKWTELVCHGGVRTPDKVSTGPNQRCETKRIDTTASEYARCSRCAALDDLGPLRPAPRGEVRRSSEDLVAVCCHHDHAGGRGWKLIAAEDPNTWSHGWRSDWDVARWERVGNVYDLVPAPAEPAAPEPDTEPDYDGGNEG